MTRDRSTPAEVADDLRLILAQCEHLTAHGQQRFLDDDLDAQLLRLAGERLIVTLQAALDDLPIGFADRHGDLPLATVRGMRNRLAHGYQDLDARIVWQTLSARLPPFIRDVIGRLD